ncbi:hypothetical protein ACFLXI_02075 [Chloroflexota bacterium]
MAKQPRHRPHRKIENAKRLILECELDECPHCGETLKPRNTWHMRKTVQTLEGPVFIGGKTKECVNEKCSHPGKHYYACQASLISLPKSTYGLDVLAYIGWQHEHEHKQLVKIQRELNVRGILINERNTGKLYRQFLAFLGAMSTRTEEKLEKAVAEHGGLIWALDALQPEGHGTLLYVLYEVLSNTPVAAIQLDHAKTGKLVEWLAPYKALPYAVLATLSDGEPTIIEALETCWPDAPRQRCQAHFLNNLADPALIYDDELRKWLRQDLGGLPKVPEDPLF